MANTYRRAVQMMCDSYAVPEGRVLAVQLFLTCRKLHEEAASYFYGHNVFKFESLRILAAFLADHNALSSRSSQWLNRISIPFRPEEPTSSGRYQLGRGLTFYDTPADYGITSTHDIWPFVAQFLTHSHLPALTQIDLRVTVTLAGTVAKGLLGSDRSMTQAQAQAMAQLPHHLTQQVQTHLTINNQVIGPNNVLTALQHLQLTNNANVFSRPLYRCLKPRAMQRSRALTIAQMILMDTYPANLMATAMKIEFTSDAFGPRHIWNQAKSRWRSLMT